MWYYGCGWGKIAVRVFKADHVGRQQQQGFQLVAAIVARHVRLD